MSMEAQSKKIRMAGQSSQDQATAIARAEALKAIKRIADKLNAVDDSWGMLLGRVDKDDAATVRQAMDAVERGGDILISLYNKLNR